MELVVGWWTGFVGDVVLRQGWGWSRYIGLLMLLWGCSFRCVRMPVWEI